MVMRFIMSARSQGKRMYARRLTQPLYIALEGPDGVGKSSVAAELQRLLCERDPALTVRIRHFPTTRLTRCAREAHRPLKAEDYLLDMENWLAFRPSPVLFPDVPRTGANPVYILDRWVQSTAVYAGLRGERIPARLRSTMTWLSSVPAATFVLLPRDPALLTDPDFGADNGTGDDYDPCKTTDAYRRLTESALGSRMPIPIVVDRERDTPAGTAEGIVERMVMRDCL